METIKLTEEHKSKLLEMCEAFFPELKDLEIRDSMEDFCFPFEHICIEANRKTQLILIHWFEFLYKHLAFKLISSLYEDEGDIQDDLIEFNNTTLLGEEHPVDYLYEEFKKLKL